MLSIGNSGDIQEEVWRVRKILRINENKMLETKHNRRYEECL